MYINPKNKDKELLYQRVMNMLSLRQEIKPEKIIACLEKFIPKAQIIMLESFEDLDRALARALSWLFLDCHYEALCVLSDNQETVNKWMPFFEACENGLNSLYLGSDRKVHALVNPSKILLDAEGRFHNNEQSAISWLDKEFYYWHGVTMPKRSILDISSYTTYEIMEEPNIEVRRALMSLYGVGHFLSKVKAKVLDHHDNPLIGTLYEWRDQDGTVLHVVECANGTLDLDGSLKLYYPFTPPSLRSVVASVKWTYPDCREISDNDYVLMQAART